jgi:hypothetical protein
VRLTQSTGTSAITASCAGATPMRAQPRSSRTTQSSSVHEPVTRWPEIDAGRWIVTGTPRSVARVMSSSATHLLCT